MKRRTSVRNPPPGKRCDAMKCHPKTQPRHLVLIVGDQLNLDSTVFDGFDPEQNAVWMAEVAGEAMHVWSHKARIALFLTAMHHFRDELHSRGVTVHYTELTDSTLGQELAHSILRLKPAKVFVEPGDWRVREELRRAARSCIIR